MIILTLTEEERNLQEEPRRFNDFSDDEPFEDPEDTEEDEIRALSDSVMDDLLSVKSDLSDVVLTFREAVVKLENLDTVFCTVREQCFGVSMPVGFDNQQLTVVIAFENASPSISSISRRMKRSLTHFETQENILTQKSEEFRENMLSLEIRNVLAEIIETIFRISDLLANARVDLADNKRDLENSSADFRNLTFNCARLDSAKEKLEDVITAIESCMLTVSEDNQDLPFITGLNYSLEDMTRLRDLMDNR